MPMLISFRRLMSVYNLVEYNFRRCSCSDYRVNAIIVIFVANKKRKARPVTQRFELAAIIAASVSESLVWDLIVDALRLKVRRRCSAMRDEVTVAETVSRALIGYETRINLSFIS